MARQAGLGRSLHEVLESLTPAEGLPEPARRPAVELEHQLDQLLVDVQELRERVERLDARVKRLQKAKKTAEKQAEKGSGANGKKKRKSKGSRAVARDERVA
jgi:TolA-binding protein